VYCCGCGARGGGRVWVGGGSSLVDGRALHTPDGQEMRCVCDVVVLTIEWGGCIPTLEFGRCRVGSVSSRQQTLGS
jgi:hypothetical protein